ncbi:uncharacterized protein [Magallana gigas]|uniref:uncharacterized protein n=1 Tax=Magallana gigas TaxID=29159 RepID=UPI003341A2D7
MSTGGIETKGVPSTSTRTHTEVSTNGGSSFSTDTPTYNTETPTKTSLSTGTSTTTLAYQTTLVDASIGVPKRQMSTGGIETKGVPSTSIRTRTETSTNGGSSFSTDTPTYTTKESLSTGTSTMTLAYQTILDDDSKKQDNLFMDPEWKDFTVLNILNLVFSFCIFVGV